MVDQDNLSHATQVATVNHPHFSRKFLGQRVAKNKNNLERTLTTAEKNTTAASYRCTIPFFTLFFGGRPFVLNESTRSTHVRPNFLHGPHGRSLSHPAFRSWHAWQAAFVRSVLIGRSVHVLPRRLHLRDDRETKNT